MTSVPPWLGRVGDLEPGSGSQGAPCALRLSLLQEDPSPSEPAPAPCRARCLRGSPAHLGAPVSLVSIPRPWALGSSNVGTRLVSREDRQATGPAPARPPITAAAVDAGSCHNIQVPRSKASLISPEGPTGCPGRLQMTGRWGAAHRTRPGGRLRTATARGAPNLSPAHGHGPRTLPRRGWMRTDTDGAPWSRRTIIPFNW